MFKFPWDKHPVPDEKTSHVFIPQFVEFTFAYEQLASIERDLAIWEAQERRFIDERRLYEQGRSVFARFVSDLLYNRQSSNLDWEGEQAWLQHYLENNASELKEACASFLDAQGRVLRAPQPDIYAWNSAMVRWYTEIRDALRATKGSATVRVPADVQPFLWGWGLNGMAWRDMEEVADAVPDAE